MSKRTQLGRNCARELRDNGRQALAPLGDQRSEKPAFELALERFIDAPCAQVFEAWSTPERMAQWFAPRPYKLIVETMDFFAGGRFSMAMRGPDGKDFPFSGVYRQIDPPARLAWSGEFASGPADQFSIEVNFEAQGQATKISVRQSFQVMTAEAEHARKGARQGWKMTLDQLAAFCAQQAHRHCQRQECERSAPQAEAAG